MLFDTHAHLDDEAFDSDREELLERLRASNVKKMVNVGASLESSKNSIELANRYEFVYAAVGIHPHEAGMIESSQLDILREWSKHKKVVAIGEIGLDYHYDFAPRDIQQKWFREQILLAEELGLPYIVHSREATQDTFEIISAHTKDSSFVLHSYSQSAEMVRQYKKLDAYFSFSGPLTFKNAAVPLQAIKEVPLDRLLIETDSPYLTPVPLRGKRNDPTNVHFVAQKAADVLGLSYDELCEITYHNALRFFNIS